MITSTSLHFTNIYL